MSSTVMDTLKRWKRWVEANVDDVAFCSALLMVVLQSVVWSFGLFTSGCK